MSQQYSRFMRWTSRTVILSILAAGMPFQSALAGIVGSAQTLSHQQAVQNRDKISAFLDRADVITKLQQQGVTIGEAKARVGALTDDEAYRIAGRLDQLPAGGDGIGNILDFIFTIFIVLLITDIFGLTKVFSFTHPIK